MKLLRLLLVVGMTLSVGCSRPPLTLTVAETPTTVTVQIANNTDRELRYSPWLLGYLKDPAGDFYVFLADQSGKRIEYCGSIDPMARPSLRLAPGKTATITEVRTRVSEAFCLDPGSRYVVAVEYVVMLGAGKNQVVFRSNHQNMQAVAPDGDGVRVEH